MMPFKNADLLGRVLVFIPFLHIPTPHLLIPLCLVRFFFFCESFCHHTLTFHSWQKRWHGNVTVSKLLWVWPHTFFIDQWWLRGRTMQQAGDSECIVSPTSNLSEEINQRWQRLDVLIPETYFRGFRGGWTLQWAGANELVSSMFCVELTFLPCSLHVFVLSFVRSFSLSCLLTKKWNQSRMWEREPKNVSLFTVFSGGGE